MHKAKFSTILYYVNPRGDLVFVSLLCVALRLHGQEPSATVPRADTTTETIIFLRHGEKPTAEYGQLNWQGLNRALALPKVLIENYGRADFIFAPDQEDLKERRGLFLYTCVGNNRAYRNRTRFAG